ncbi:(Na+)-NQR maturation NqrM [Cellvibrio sp. UBA7661]|uniref:(Na+)-NQR maturation NqrM n=1 Tax=Cellvibrio sp. UBA7661 TaxID=1946311 RepID=UPI002F352327
MAVLLVTLVIMLFVALALSISVLAGRKPVSGSCGGVGKALGDPNYVCELCGGDEAKCAEQKVAPLPSKDDANNLSYDASRSSKE